MFILNYMPTIMRKKKLWKSGELENLCYDIKTSWDLPQEETDVNGVKCNVKAS